MISLSALLVLVGSLFICGKSVATEHNHPYEKICFDGHVIHCVRLQLGHYEVSLAKARRGPQGPETVSDIAHRLQADFAINGGFFDVEGQERKPSGTLVLNGVIHKLQEAAVPLVVVRNDHVSLQMTSPKSVLEESPKDTSLSLLSGGPLLIQNGALHPDLVQWKGDTRHARTALGIAPEEGVLILVVVEQPCKRDLMAMTLGEVQSFVTAKHM